jgi:hypothetical protein
MPYIAAEDRPRYEELIKSLAGTIREATGDHTKRCRSFELRSDATSFGHLRSRTSLLAAQRDYWDARVLQAGILSTANWTVRKYVC